MNAVSKTVEDRAELLLGDSGCDHIAPERRLEQHIRDCGLQRHAIGAGRFKLNIAITVDDAGAEHDRRDMPLAGGPQAHQKPDGTLGNIVLDDRRVRSTG